MSAAVSYAGHRSRPTGRRRAARATLVVAAVLAAALGSGPLAVAAPSLAGVPVPAAVAAAATKAFPKAPVPTISGTVRAGQTVTAKPGTWSPTPTSYTYLWKSDNKRIIGATKSTYTIPDSLRGKKLSVVVTAKRAGYTTTSKTSEKTVVVGRFTKAPFPVVSGSAKVGSTLKATAGTWSPTPTKLTYQWQASGRSIAGATGSSYKVTSKEVGHTLTVTVTASRSGYVTTNRASTATAKVPGAPTSITKDGTYRVGTQIAPGTYVAQAVDQYGCYWERRTDAGESITKVIGNSFNLGQRIVTISATDPYFYTEGCGTWKRWTPSGAALTSTPAFGMSQVGTGAGLLRPGTYKTAGATTSCVYMVLSDFSGEYRSLIEQRQFTGAATVTIPATAKAFDTVGCSWKRVG